ncbi:DUF1292 domain-containing protein [Mesobacillus harenae]|uniref:DUF1292 domain-containing protein n=1 Tax=Mesobacillus harenae TaxID=2213203 RepID=UPI0015810EC0|nr:DUF1292 domain-containing protein [Mesobacillus harenae]
MDKVEVGETFIITDEENQDQEVEVIATLGIDGTDYLAVSFVEDLQEAEEGDIDIFFLKVDDEGDLAAIETDEEFEKVSTAFEEVMDEEEEDTEQ